FLAAPRRRWRGRLEGPRPSSSMGSSAAPSALRSTIEDMGGRERQTHTARGTLYHHRRFVDLVEPVVEVQPCRGPVLLGDVAAVAPVEGAAGLFAFGFAVQAILTPGVAAHRPRA